MISRTALLFAVTALAAGSSIGAQSPVDAKADITVTGCLQKGLDGQLVIANADVPATDNRQPRMDPTGATDVTPAPKVVKNWWLQGEANLEAHVGQRIEVIGRELEAVPTGGKATPGAIETSGTSGAETKDAKDAGHNARRLQVKTVKVLTAACSAS